MTKGNKRFCRFLSLFVIQEESLCRFVIQEETKAAKRFLLNDKKSDNTKIKNKKIYGSSRFYEINKRIN
jgi:hypothetical protein